LISLLNPHADCIVLNLPGSDSADFLPEIYGFDFLSMLMKKVVDILYPYKRINVISASYGTPIAYTYAVNYKANINKLVMAGTMPKLPEDIANRIPNTIKYLHDNDMKRFIDYTIDGLLYLEKPELVKNCLKIKRILTRQLKNLTNDQEIKYIHNTTRILNQKELKLESLENTKSLVFTGEHDIFTCPEHCELFSKTIKNSLFTTIKNADHLFHLQQFENYSELIYKFMACDMVYKSKRL